MVLTSNAFLITRTPLEPDRAGSGVILDARARMRGMALGACTARLGVAMDKPLFGALLCEL